MGKHASRLVLVLHEIGSAGLASDSMYVKSGVMNKSMRVTSVSAINIYRSNIQGQMGAYNKDLHDNYILIDDFMLILELIVFLL